MQYIRHSEMASHFHARLRGLSPDNQYRATELSMPLLL